MRYFKIIKNNSLIAIGTGTGGTEITESEYNALLSEIREKAALVDKLYNGEITLDDVPAEWRDEIRRRVTERQEAEQAEPEQLLADYTEVLDIMTGEKA